MNTKTHTNALFLAIGVAAVLALAVATTLSSSAYAISDNWEQSCSGPEDPQDPGDCAGQSEKSGPHDEELRNKGGNLPQGHQEDDD
jgi:hypothetical protein